MSYAIRNGFPFVTNLALPEKLFFGKDVIGGHAFSATHSRDLLQFDKGHIGWFLANTDRAPAPLLYRAGLSTPFVSKRTSPSKVSPVVAILRGEALTTLGGCEMTSPLNGMRLLSALARVPAYLAPMSGLYVFGNRFPCVAFVTDPT